MSYLPVNETDRPVSLRRACRRRPRLRKRAHTKAAEDAREQQRDLVDVVEPAVKRGLRDMCDSPADAVKAGPDRPEAPSSDLWRVHGSINEGCGAGALRVYQGSVTPGTVGSRAKPRTSRRRWSARCRPSSRFRRKRRRN